MAFTYAGQYTEVVLGQSAAGFAVALQALTVNVYTVGTTTAVTLYTSRTKGSTASNPATTDVNGNLTFYANPGQYDIVFTPPGGSQKRVTVMVPQDPAEDSATYLTVGAGLANGTDDTTIVQAALDVVRAAGGGQVKGIPGQSYIFSTLVVGSNTTLDFEGCSITQKASAGVAYLLRNYSDANPAATASDGAVTSGSNVVTTALGASAVVGQTLVFAAAGGNGNGPLVGNVSARTSTTITLTTLDGRPCNATATIASGGTVTLYNRESNITVRGGRWDKGANGQTTLLGTLAFRHVDGLTVDVDSISSTAITRGICLADCTGFRITIRGGNLTGVMCLPLGPLYKGRIEHMAGTSSDDFLAIQASDFTPHQDSAGDIIDVTVGTIQGTGTGAAQLLKVLAGAGRYVDGIKVDGQVSGSVATGYLAWVGDDPGSTQTTGGTYGRIDLGTLRGDALNGLLWLITPAAKHIKAALRSNMGLLATNRGAYMSGASTATVELLELDFDIDAATNSTFTAGFEKNESVVTIKRLVLTGRYSMPASQAPPLVAIDGGTVDQIDCSARVDGTTLGFIIRQVGGTINRTNFIGGAAVGCNGAFRKESAAAGNSTVTFAGGFTCLTTGRVADVRAGTVSFKLAGCHFDTITNGAFFTNGATLNFYGDAMTTNGTFTMLQRNASEVVAAYGNSLPFDLAALARVVGEYCTDSLNKTTTGVMPVVCTTTAAGGWKNVAAGTF